MKKVFITDINETSSITPKIKLRRKTIIKTHKTAINDVIPFGEHKEAKDAMKVKMEKVRTGKRKKNYYFTLLPFWIGWIGSVSLFVLAVFCMLFVIPIGGELLGLDWGHSTVLDWLSNNLAWIYLSGWIIAFVSAIIWRFNPNAKKPPTWSSIAAIFIMAAVVGILCALGLIIGLFIFMLIASIVSSFK